MEKVIELDLIEENDFFETYNRREVSKDLVNYLINACHNVKQKEKIKIVINDVMNKNIDCKKMIRQGLKKEYKICQKRREMIFKKQIIYFVFGSIILFIATQISSELFREVVLICGWVLIWSMMELEIFTDVDSKKRRKALKKLMDSEFIENNLL